MTAIQTDAPRVVSRDEWLTAWGCQNRGPGEPWSHNSRAALIITGGLRCTLTYTSKSTEALEGNDRLPLR